MTDTRTVEQTYCRHFSHNFVSQYLHILVLLVYLVQSTLNGALVGKWPWFFARITIFHNGGHVLTNVTTNRVRLFSRKHPPPAWPLDSFGRNWQQHLAWASLYRRYLNHRTKKRAARRSVAPFDHFISSTLREWFWDITKVDTKALQAHRREPKRVRASPNATVCKVKH